MISYVFACILWAKPDIKLVEIPVSEYATAHVAEKLGDFEFSADVFEGKVNSIQITHSGKQITTMALAPFDYAQKSLFSKLDISGTAASMDCDIR